MKFLPSRSDESQSSTDFLLHIIPNTTVDAFAKGDVLEVLFVALLCGFALSAAGPRAKPMLNRVDSLTQVVFRIVGIPMKFAPIGAFGAMAFRVGKYGIASLGPLGKLIETFYLTCILLCPDCEGGGPGGRFRHCQISLLYKGRDLAGWRPVHRRRRRPP
ncbi:MAG TPA: cation:dicarboxylase symporter family transporter [Candidatus Acidoferrales bacterium]|nr:cation:dicarboxylase symporter family transporter [Candidatus Acidoferrales bacterium]